MTQFENATIIKKANVYFDGRCVSHTVHTDGKQVTVGVILPGTLTFSTSSPETMEVVEGECRFRLEGSGDWQTCRAGDAFRVPANARFDIENSDVLHYVCHYG